MTPMSLTKREMNGVCSMRIAIDWQKRRRDAVILIGIGIFLTIIQPYGSNNALPFWARWLYWTGLIFYGSLVGEFVMWRMDIHFPKLHLAARLLIISLLTALAITPVIILLQGFAGDNIPMQAWPIMYGFVWVIAAGMTGVGYLLDQGADQDASNPSSAPKGPDTFLERLPIKYRGAALYAVSSEDHYLRVHTDRGEELILMRLADALRELAGVDGMQTHRSWWVSTSGIADTKRDNGRTSLVLKSGAEAPVSRSYAKAVREKGLN